MNQADDPNFNPFSTKFWTPGALPYGFDDKIGLEFLVETIATKRIVQIVGPHGSGKSTLLKTLIPYFVQKHFFVKEAFLNDQNRRLSDDFIPRSQDDSTLFLLDGYEQLSVAERFRLRLQSWKKTAGLVLTTHRPALWIPILHRTEARFARFQKLVYHLSAASSFQPDDATLRDIFDHSGGNFRTAFFLLYDLFSDLNRTDGNEAGCFSF